MLRAVVDADVELYYDGSEKLATTATGIDVTGTVTADGLVVQSTSASATVASFKGSTGFGLAISASAVAPYVQNIGTAAGEEISLSPGGVRTALFQDGGDISFYDSTGVSQSLFWDASAGSLGIGTTIPANKLDVRNTSTDYQLHLGDTASTVLGYELGRENTAGLFKFYGNQTGATGYIFSGVDGERMRVDASGNLLIDYTSSNGAYKLQVNSQIFATSATIATSDGRYKENVEPLSGALDLVAQLNPVQFDWKEHPVHNFDRESSTVGFIAQEVQSVLADKPYLNSIVKRNECVIEPEETDDDGNVIKDAVTEEFFGIAEGNMIALLTKALQEQQAIIESLTARIEALEGAN